jgi:hypothetical protein
MINLRKNSLAIKFNIRFMLILKAKEKQIFYIQETFSTGILKPAIHPTFLSIHKKHDVKLKKYYFAKKYFWAFRWLQRRALRAA